MQLESDVIRAELGPDESLLWSGQPGPLRPADALPLLGAVALGIYAGWRFRQGSVDLNTLLVGVIAVANLGGILYAVLSRFRTYYGVTTRRILIVDTLLKRRVQSFDLLALDHVSLDGPGQERGTLILQPARFGLIEGVSLPAPDERKNPSPCLHRIRDAEAVRRIVEDARSALARRDPA